jgi:hypothetical protein
MKAIRMRKIKLFHSILLISSLALIQNLHSDQINCNLPIKKVILWGHKLHSHTNSYIFWGFHRAFKHLGYDTYWFDNNDDVSNFDFSNSLFITEWQADQKIPLREDCFYILHYFTEKYRHLFKSGRCIFMQIYTHECLTNHPSKIDTCIYAKTQDLSSNHSWSGERLPREILALYPEEKYAQPYEISTIYMPWATDLLPHEIEANKKNLCTNKKNEIVYVGTIGGGVYGNIEKISPFRRAASENNISFNHIKDCSCSMETNIEFVKNAYMAPAIQMTLQVDNGYIPCRIFKNISYGAFGITNSETVYELFNKKIVYNPDTYQLFFDAKEKLDNLDINELYELMDFVKEKHTYVNRIQLLLTFLETVYNFKNNF